MIIQPLTEDQAWAVKVGIIGELCGDKPELHDSALATAETIIKKVQEFLGSVKTIRSQK